MGSFRIRKCFFFFFLSIIASIRSLPFLY